MRPVVETGVESSPPVSRATTVIVTAISAASALTCAVADGGIERPAVETHDALACIASVRVLVEADLRGWLPRMGVSLPEPIIEATLAEADDALAPYVTRTPDGSVSFATSALVLRATAA